MGNIERLRNIEEAISAAVDQLNKTFKERIQSILTDNQLLLSKQLLVISLDKRR